MVEVGHYGLPNDGKVNFESVSNKNEEEYFWLMIHGMLPSYEQTTGFIQSTVIPTPSTVGK